MNDDNDSRSAGERVDEHVADNNNVTIKPTQLEAWQKRWPCYPLSVGRLRMPDYKCLHEYDPFKDL